MRSDSQSNHSPPKMTREPSYIFQGGRLVAVNEALAHLLGYRPGELEGQAFVSIAPAAHQEIILRSLIADGQPPTQLHEVQTIHKNGSLIDVLLAAESIEWQGLPAVQVNFKKASSPGSSIGNSQSLSEGRQPPTDNGPFDAELVEARKETKRLALHKEKLLGAMREMVLLINKDYVIEYMNPSAVQTFGRQRGRCCHEALCRLAEPCQSPCPVKLLDQAESLDFIESKMGEMEVEFSVAPFRGYRGDDLALVVMRDITSRKQLEKELNEFNHDLEKVIRKKIVQLKESENIRKQLSHEVDALRRQLDRERETDGMVGSSRAIRELREAIYEVADADATVLITGESGTGKELVANLIHQHSRRKDKRFFKFNCATVSESLLESDLFGYEKGAFTGAVSRRQGKFEYADGGTILLDEIGDISSKMQAALLRILQNGEMQRVGSSETIDIDVRVIAATNVDLVALVEKKKFRKDLYYRLNIINLHIPPLRERKDDIPPLVTHFVTMYRQRFRKNVEFISQEVLDLLLAHDWPGNIRELENVIQRAVVLAKGNTMAARDLALSPMVAGAARAAQDGAPALGAELRPLKEAVAELEKQIIAAALKNYEGNVQEAAKALEIGKTAFYERMKRYGLG